MIDARYLPLSPHVVRSKYDILKKLSDRDWQDLEFYLLSNGKLAVRTRPGLSMERVNELYSKVLPEYQNLAKHSQFLRALENRNRFLLTDQEGERLPVRLETTNSAKEFVTLLGSQSAHACLVLNLTWTSQEKYPIPAFMLGLPSTLFMDRGGRGSEKEAAYYKEYEALESEQPDAAFYFIRPANEIDEKTPGLSFAVEFSYPSVTGDRARNYFYIKLEEVDEKCEGTVKKHKFSFFSKKERVIGTTKEIVVSPCDDIQPLILKTNAESSVFKAQEVLDQWIKLCLGYQFKAALPKGAEFSLARIQFLPVAMAGSKLAGVTPNVSPASSDPSSASDRRLEEMLKVRRALDARNRRHRALTGDTRPMPPEDPDAYGDMPVKPDGEEELHYTAMGEAGNTPEDQYDPMPFRGGGDDRSDKSSTSSATSGSGLFDRKQKAPKKESKKDKKRELTPGEKALAGYQAKKKVEAEKAEKKAAKEAEKQRKADEKADRKAAKEAQKTSLRK